MSQKEMIFEKMIEISLSQIPRLLSQIDRDPRSPLMGSSDRNYWHYKIRDFSSAILQQSGLALDSLIQISHPHNLYYQNESLKEVIKATAKFWSKIQLRSGGFNEYYPNESGYPPTAFSSYAVALLCKRQPELLEDGKIKKSLEKSAKFLLSKFEAQALNQQGAGISAVGLIKSLGLSVDETQYENVLSQFLNSQNSEGWFNEYDGMDIGYLSVTVDCLIDLYEATKDERVLTASKRAIKFINSIVLDTGEWAHFVNSRNTNYIVPYGISYLAQTENYAKELLEKLTKAFDKDPHYLQSIDDRYISHYILQSFTRCAELMGQSEYGLTKEKPEKRPSLEYFKEAGIVRASLGSKNDTEYIISLSKGGILYQYSQGSLKTVDFGLDVYLKDGKLLSQHWQGPRNRYECYENEAGYLLKSEGPLLHIKKVTSSPLKHLILRFLSFCFGSKIIPMLKNIFIFTKKDTGLRYKREIQFKEDQIIIKDEITGETSRVKKIARSPAFSLRHVSSVGTFHEEQLLGSLAVENTQTFSCKRTIE